MEELKEAGAPFPLVPVASLGSSSGPGGLIQGHLSLGQLGPGLRTGHWLQGLGSPTAGGEGSASTAQSLPAGLAPSPEAAISWKVPRWDCGPVHCLLLRGLQSQGHRGCPGG